MGKQKNRSWLLNIMIVLALIAVVFAFGVHYKNWTKMEGDSYRIWSGIYYLDIPFAEMDSIGMVERLPSMERFHGFSVNEIEKGVFKKDSIGENRVYVFVEKLSRPKIRVVYQDSLQVFLNFRDSTETQKVYGDLERILNRAAK